MSFVLILSPKKLIEVAQYKLIGTCTNMKRIWQIQKRRVKKARTNNPKVRVMLIIFSIRGIVNLHWVPEGQIIHNYLLILAKLCEWRRKKNDPGKYKSRVLFKDDASAHSPLQVDRILAKCSFPVWPSTFIP